MSTSLYLRSVLWDFVLTLVASGSLAYTLLNGFYTASELQYGPVPAVVCVVVLLALFAVASSARVARVGGVLFGVALIASWVVAASLTPDGAWLVDNESNYLIFTMCTTLCALGSFLLSRTRTGAALLFIVGAFLIAFIQFFYQSFDVMWAFAFVASSLALIIFKNYQRSLKSSTSVKKVAFTPGFAVSLVAVALAVGAGVGIWYGIIAPLDPPAADIKLITEYRALETVRVRGISDVYQTPNLDMTSDVTNDDERTTDDIKESEDGRRVPANGNPETQEQDDGSESSQGMNFMGIDIDSIQDNLDLFDYDTLRLGLIIAGIVILLLLIGYFVGRRMWRKRRLQRISKLSPSDQVEQLYPFFLDRFKRLGMGMAPGQTLREYAIANASTMEQFDKMSNVRFADLTSDYVAVAYGSEELGPDAAERLSSYYNAFWKAARQKIGNVKYFFKSFRL